MPACGLNINLKGNVFYGWTNHDGWTVLTVEAVKPTQVTLYRMAKCVNLMSIACGK